MKEVKGWSVTSKKKSDDTYKWWIFSCLGPTKKEAIDRATRLSSETWENMRKAGFSSIQVTIKIKKGERKRLT